VTWLFSGERCSAPAIFGHIFVENPLTKRILCLLFLCGFGNLHLSISMKKLLLTITFAVAFAAAPAQAQLIASDNGGNYGLGWTNGANGGTGFQAWSLGNNNNGTTLFAGNFIGNPGGTAGIGGMSATSFGLYANPVGAFSTAERLFSTALSAGDTFSFQWGVNWDSGASGNKGFVIFGGTNEWVNVNNGGSSTITFNGADTGFGFGTNSMTWSFAYNGSSFAVTANDRDGVGTFSTNVALTNAPTGFRFYASGLQSGDQAQPYFNNLSVVPEPSTYALLALSAAGLAGYAARRRARK